VTVKLYVPAPVCGAGSGPLPLLHPLNPNATNANPQTSTAHTPLPLRRSGHNKSRPANPRPKIPVLSWLVIELAAVLTESKVGTAAVPATVVVAGLKLQLAFAGRPEHANVTSPENPAAPVTLMGALTDWPACTVNVVFPLPSGARVNAAFTTWLSDVEEACVLPSPE
jgi:hypothetical protein